MSKYYSIEYLQFHKLDYHNRVRYFEEVISNNLYLDYEEKIELYIDYSFALFEIGKYEKFLSIVDSLIETVIKENIYTIKGTDVYSELLFKKSCALYNLNKLDEAIQLLRQVTKINPNKTYSTILTTFLRRQNIRKFKLISSFTVLFFIISLGTRLIDIFLIETFYNEYHDESMNISLTFFALGSSFLFIQIGRYIYERYFR